MNRKVLTKPQAKEEEELDFDDPSFLIEPNRNDDELNYKQRREKNLIKGLERGRRLQNNNNKGRKRLEEETREEGLRTNLIQKDIEDGNQSKALKMMKSMGYTPGEGLGKSSIPIASSSTISGFGGIGSRKRLLSPTPPPLAISTPTASSSTLPTQAKPRTEPLTFTLREGRKGLGPSKPPPIQFSLSSAQLSSNNTSTSEYQIRQISTQVEKKLQGQLIRVSRICEELDRRKYAAEFEKEGTGKEGGGKGKEIEVNPMWFLRPVGEGENELETGREGLKKKRRRGEYMILDEDVEEEEIGKKGRSGELGYEKGFSKIVVDSQEEQEAETEERKKRKEKKGEEDVEEDIERIEEEKEWFSFDPKTRLDLTLKYLRKTHHYCLFCGAQFNDATDMKESCPGEEEDDH